MAIAAIRSATALVMAVSCLLVGACSYVAVHSAAPKRAATVRGAAALQADRLFWETLHGGEYQNIPAALEATTAAYLQDPTDATTAAHVAWLHIWRVAERSRLHPAPATITDDMLLAQRYFQEGVALNPSDARYLGFLSAATLASGAINGDEREQRRGYFLVLAAIKAWPEFNLFTGGYSLSQQPADSPRFREALEWQWRNLDACIDGRIDRSNPDYSTYMRLATTRGTKRVCWNSWIAPHNFEGFFLNMGDMLVKSGDWRLAQRIYADAKLSPTYAGWNYRAVLEDRIRDAEKNVALFRSAATGDGSPAMMIASDFACMACHRQ